MTVSFTSCILRYVGGKELTAYFCLKMAPTARVYILEAMAVCFLPPLTLCSLLEFPSFLYRASNTKPFTEERVKKKSQSKKKKNHRVFKLFSVTISRFYESWTISSGCLAAPFSGLELSSDFRFVSAFTRDDHFQQSFRHCRFMYKDF